MSGAARKGVAITHALVTGAAGFIGSHVCAALVRRGAQVTGLDVTGADWWRHTELGITCARSDADLHDETVAEHVIADGQFSHVIHLASITDVTRDEMLVEKMIHEHILVTKNVLHAARGTVRRVVVAGTCEEYGDGAVPFEEGQREVAVSPYAWSKICVSHLCQLYARIFGVPVVIVRPFLTYGPLQTSSMLVPAAIRAALQDKDFEMTPGEQTREFNYIDDIVEGVIRAAEAGEVDGALVNLAGGVEARVGEVVEKIYALCGSAGRVRRGVLPYRAGETMHFYGSGAKAQEVLHWSVRTPLEQGLRATIEWYCGYLKRRLAER